MLITPDHRGPLESRDLPPEVSRRKSRRLVRGSICRRSACRASDLYASRTYATYVYILYIYVYTHTHIYIYTHTYYAHIRSLFVQACILRARGVRPSSHSSRHSGFQHWLLGGFGVYGGCVPQVVSFPTGRLRIVTAEISDLSTFFPLPRITRPCAAGFSSKLSAPHRGLTDHDLLSVTGRSCIIAGRDITESFLARCTCLM